MLYFSGKRPFGLCLAVGVALICAATRAADPWAWGANTNGELGDGTTTHRHTPVQVSGLSNVVAFAGGWSHSLAIKNDGTVWACGWNGYGLLGDGTTTERHTPVQVSGLSNAVAVAAGNNHSLAVMKDGTVQACGYNYYGQLGDGTTTDRHTPVQVSGLSNVVAVACGVAHSLALKNDGTVWAWGDNSKGQLGDGTTTQRDTPVQASGLGNLVSVACGHNHSLALKKDGTVWAWGQNAEGELGDGTTTERHSPVQVSGLSNAVAVAGCNHGLALKNDGTVWAWGYNKEGQLGDGTTTYRQSPGQVSGLSNIVAVAAGGHSLALKNDGTVWAWGYNAEGQLGDGTTTDRYTPVQVSGLSNVVAVAAGAFHSLATVGAPAAGPAAKLAFTTPPSDSTAGAAFGTQPVVAVQDANGNTVTTDTSSVTLALANNPGGGTLSGTTTVAAVNGVATFSGLSIDKAGTGYTLAASDGTLTGATSSAFDIGPPGPAITSISASKNPLFAGDTTTLVAQASNPNNGTLTFTWDFGDTTALGATNPVSHTFATAGQYTVTLTVSDGTYTSQPRQIVITVYAPNSGGESVKNIADGKPAVANPLNGLALSVPRSDGGVVELFIDVEAMNKAAFDVATDFAGLASHLSQVFGIHPCQKFADPSVYVATSTAYDTGTDNVRGKARLTLAVGNREVGLPVRYTQEPASREIYFKNVKGKFGFSPAQIAKGDTVSLIGIVELPEGLKVADEQDLAIGIGNIIDHVKLDSKGKGKGTSDNGRIKKVTLKYPKVDKTSKETAGPPDKRMARIEVRLATMAMVAGGFDTEGVAPQSDGKQLSIQVAFVLAGVAYENTVPVTLRVSRKQDLATLVQSRR